MIKIGGMTAFAPLISVHLAVEGKDETSLDTLPGKLTVTRTEEVGSKALRRPGRVERTSQEPRDHAQDLFRKTPGDEIAVCVTGLERGEPAPEKVALLCEQRVDSETVFDELKNQWGFRGYSSRKTVVSQLAVHRPTLLPTRVFCRAATARTDSRTLPVYFTPIP